MPALTTPGGPAQAWVPDWKPGAITWTRHADQRQFSVPSNPVQTDDTAPTFVTNRQTQDGSLTYVWGVNPEQAPLTFVTFEEGIDPWRQFRDDFRGVSCTYYNALDSVLMPVTITDVRWQASGQNPASWRVTVSQQEAEPFTS